MKKILLVEDSPSLSRALEAKLKKEGFGVTKAPNGQKGLGLIKQESFGLVVLDLNMPLKNGVEVLKEMQKSGNSTPVVVLTNFSRHEQLEQLKSFGVVNYFLKIETSLADLVNFINKFIQTQTSLNK